MKLFSKKYKAFTMAAFPTAAMAFGVYITGTNEQWGAMIICVVGVAVGATIMYFMGKDKK